MRVERPPQGKRLADLDYKCGQSLIPGVTSFKLFGLSFLILKLTSIILKTLIIDYAKAFDCVDHYKLWKILKETGITHHLTCLLGNLYAGQEATVRIGHGKTDWFQIGKGVRQGCILSPCLFNLYAVHHEKRWAGEGTSWN